MAYRADLDLEFLKDCDNEDLDILIAYIVKGKDGNERLTEELTTSEKYKHNYPIHREYWDLIAAEVQCFGANTIATIFRGGEGVLYKEILMNVSDKLSVNYNKKASTEVIEMNLLMKILTDSLEKMSAEELKSIVDELGLKTTNYTKQAVVAALQAAIQFGKFRAFQVAVVVANAVAKILLQRGLTFAANRTITRALSIFAGPIGWVITGVWTLIDVAGPAYRVTIPSVIQIAYMRAKKESQLVT